MAKLSSLKIKMGQMQYEKQRKEHKLQTMKVGLFSGWPFCLLYDYGFWPLPMAFILCVFEWKKLQAVA